MVQNSTDFRNQMQGIHSVDNNDPYAEWAFSALGLMPQQEYDILERNKRKLLLITHLQNFRKTAEALEASLEHAEWMDNKWGDALIGALGKSSDLLSGAYSTLFYLFQYKKANMGIGAYIQMIASQGIDTWVGLIGRKEAKGKSANTGTESILTGVGTLWNLIDIIFKSNVFSANLVQKKKEADIQQFVSLLDGFGITTNQINTVAGIDTTIQNLQRL